MLTNVERDVNIALSEFIQVNKPSVVLISLCKIAIIGRSISNNISLQVLVQKNSRMGEVEEHDVHLYVYHLMAWCAAWLLACFPFRDPCNHC